MRPEWIRPDWPAPSGVHALSTTRTGGCSKRPYDGLNLADHVGDIAEDVARNRAALVVAAGLPAEPCWLQQVHGSQAVQAGVGHNVCADAVFGAQPGEVCAVLTADCLPLLLCRRDAAAVAAIHAGWRGLLAGVIENTVHAAGGGDWLAWLGPAIGPEAFEVGDEVYAAFVAEDPQSAVAFRPVRPGHWLADLYGLARLRLARVGISAVYGGDRCTYREAEHFYSYRRDGQTGRMASLIWLA